MPATLVGLILAAFGTFVGAITHHVSPVFLLTNITALLVVIIGALGATMASFELEATTGVFKAIMVTLFPKKGSSPSDTINRLVEFARKARHEGLLALESEVGNLDDVFMKRGLQLAIDGSDPEAVAQVMKTDIKAMKARHKVGAEWCMTFGIFAPTFGIIGAVIGLIETMANLNNPEKLGAGIAGAPKMGDKAAWAARIAQGADTLHTHALQGFQGKGGYMPPKGGRTDLSDQSVINAVDYMVAASQ